MSDARYRAAVRIARKAYLGARARAAAPVEQGGEALRSRAAPVRALVPDLACSRLTGAQQDAVLQLRAQFGANPHEAQAVFVAALLDPAPSRARAQLLRLAPLIGAPVATRVPAATNALARLAPIARYPLLEGLIATVAVLPDAARLALVRVARAFEPRIAPLDALRFATVRLLLRSLLQAAAADAVPAVPAQAGGLPSLETHAAPAALLCSLIARCTTGDGESLQAYRAGLDGLLPPRSRPPFTTSPIDAGAVDDAVQRIAGLPYAQRTSVAAALVRVIAANGSLSAQEFDLLRAICGGLAVPVPNTGSLRRESSVRVQAGG
jgi:hypothetical protein